MRDVDPELMFDGAKQIADEIAEERIDRECRLKEQIAKAQRADSPGGKNITATEALPIIAEANGTINLLAGEAQVVANGIKGSELLKLA